MRALITGASGFVGHHLIQHLLECGDEVIGTGLSDPHSLTSNSGVQQLQLDVRDSRRVRQVVLNTAPDVIYHLAGIAFVPEAERNFELALAVNAGGTLSIVDAASALPKAVTVVLVSTGEVYGKVLPPELPLEESSITKPCNHYALTKVMAEAVPLRYVDSAHLRTVTIRPFNHIGAGQDERFVASSFARQLARIALGKADSRILVGNLEAERDFSDVRDIVRGYRLAALHGKGLYNFGSGRAVPVQYLLDTLISISGLSVTIERDPSRLRPSDMPVHYCCREKAKRELGWTPTYALEETLRWIYEDALRGEECVREATVSAG